MDRRVAAFPRLLSPTRWPWVEKPTGRWSKRACGRSASWAGSTTRIPPRSRRRKERKVRALTSLFLAHAARNPRLHDTEAEEFCENAQQLFSTDDDT
jgi:hypothetical protein